MWYKRRITTKVEKRSVSAETGMCVARKAGEEISAPKRSPNSLPRCQGYIPGQSQRLQPGSRCTSSMGRRSRVQAPPRASLAAPAHAPEPARAHARERRCVSRKRLKGIGALTYQGERHRYCAPFSKASSVRPYDTRRWTVKYLRATTCAAVNRLGTAT